ncbi:MAG: hypothetical protein CMN04_01935 [Roseibacillus sp.]|nr:hypothetical protein [Roseibacillus sp.]
MRSFLHSSKTLILRCLALLATGALHAAPVINEIHYNNDLNYIATEFIELHNPGPEAVALTDWKLAGGIDFTFPENSLLEAGAYVVVAENPATLRSEFSSPTGDLRVVGPYAGGLSGEGETIELFDNSGERIDRVSFDIDFPWPIAADGAGSSMELIHPDLDNDLGSSWRSSSNNGALGPPTPSAANSVYSTVAPPNIRQVRHDPQQPASTEDLIVTAKVTDPDGVGAVTLAYTLILPGRYIPAFLAKPYSELLSNPTAPRQPNPAYLRNWLSVAMTDDGLGADAVAGDSIYTATIPANSYQNRTLIRYRITVRDSEGTSATAPFPDDESLNFSCFVYDGLPDYETTTRTYSADTVLNTLPAYHLLTSEEDYDQCVAYDGNQIPRNSYDARSAFNWSATFVYDGIAYDNIGYRLRQRNARYSNRGKRSFRFRFNRGNYVQLHDIWGNPYPTKWRTLNSHKMHARGGTNFGLYEAANSILWNTTGTAAPFTHWFHFRVIKSTEEAPDQYRGDFYGFLLATEDYDRRFLEAHDLEKGNLYKLKSGLTEGSDVIRYHAPRGAQGGADYENIIFNLRPNRNDSWLRQHVDWDSWYHYHAIVDAVRHYDVQPNTAEHLKNRAYYFKPNRSRFGLLQVLPWDSDTSWGPNWNGGEDFCKYAMGSRAEFNMEYRNVVREIRDLLWQPSQINGLIDMLQDRVISFQQADRLRWTNAPASAGSQTDGDIRLRTRDMKMFAFTGGSWTGGDTGTMAPASRDSGTSGREGRDAYLDELSADSAIPDTPVITDLSDPGHPANGLRFSSSAFSDNSGGFGAMEYRIAHHAPYTRGDNVPFPFEWTATWETGELSEFTPEIRPPASAVKGGQTYRARVRHKDTSGRWSHWSDPLEFQASNPVASAYQENLVISEIMYNPAGPDDAEYLELHNIGPDPLDLTDVRFTKGIDYDFEDGTVLASGAYLLIVRNRLAFEERYGSNLPVAGEYLNEEESRLENDGERIKIALGTFPIHDFVYDDTLPWPEEADAGGFSMELMRTSDNSANDPLDPLGHGIPTNWRLGGSPGRTGSQTFEGADPLDDSDQDGLPAFLEHALGSDNLNPLSGPELLSAGSPDGTLTFTFQRKLAADDVLFTVEVSRDLILWTNETALVSETAGSDGTSIVTYTPTFEAGNDSRLFMRLRATLVDPLP